MIRIRRYKRELMMLGTDNMIDNSDMNPRPKGCQL